MEFGTMMGLLLSGLRFTAIIFVVTLVGALPLGVLVALWPHEQVQAAVAVGAVLHFGHARHAVDAAADDRGCSAHTTSSVLSLGTGLEVRRVLHRLHPQLRRVLRARSTAAASSPFPRGQYEAAEVLGYTRAPDVHEDHPAAGDQAHPARHGQRGHHAGEGHVHWRSCWASWRCSRTAKADRRSSQTSMHAVRHRGVSSTGCSTSWWRSS